MKKLLGILLTLSIFIITAITCNAEIIQAEYKIKSIYFDKYEKKYYGRVFNPRDKKDVWEVRIEEKVYKKENKLTTKKMNKKYIGKSIIVIYENMDTKNNQDDDWIINQFTLDEDGL